MKSGIAKEVAFVLAGVVTASTVSIALTLPSVNYVVIASGITLWLGFWTVVELSGDNRCRQLVRGGTAYLFFLGFSALFVAYTRPAWLFPLY